jgi:dTDP-4-amino-4,6-dideoxygalactose transaminase
VSEASGRIPLSRLELDAEIRERALAALDSGVYILGPECQAFERELAAYFGVEHAVLVSNATAGIQLTLAALGVGAGDEVLVPSHTAFPTVEAVIPSGATPVFVDTDETHTVDPADLAARIGPRTRAIVPVHLFGHPCAMDEILALARQRGIPVVEDCAQAHGALYRGHKAGSLGQAGVLSFYPSKNLPVPGDGGAVLCDDGRLVERLRMLRNHGRRDKHTHEISGWNMRMNDIQAAVGRVFLARLDARNAARRRIAARYRELLAGLPLGLPLEREYARHVYHLFVIETEDRDGLRKHLAARDIETGIHFPVPNHLQPATRRLFAAPARLPHTEEAALRILSIPCFPALSDADVERVGTAVRDFFGAG